LSISALKVSATHLRAGEITAERNGNSPLNIRFTLTLYFALDQFDQQSATLDFGNGQTQTVNRTSTAIIGNNTSKNVFIFTHTYSGIGTFNISYVGENRNAGVINMSNSVSQTFSVQTTITIDPLIGLNNTPRLQFDPIDIAAVGQRFEHNPGAYDVDGDSIAFELAVPRKNVALPVDGYASPIDWSTQSEDGGAPQFSIDAITGDLVWDSPNTVGEYNVAFFIKEYRDGELISRITRDMQIMVRETANIRPRLNFNDICVKANTFIDHLITATDANGHDITITSAGEPYNNVTPTFSIFTNNGVLQNQPATGFFQWQTNCNHVNKDPYRVIFKAEDAPNSTAIPKLVDFKTLNVRIIGPEPQNLTTSVVDNYVNLKWNKYICSNAEKITIWRKDGASGYNPGTCETGLPPSLGFIKVGEVGINDTTFIDFNDGRGVEMGRIYCYRIFAVFPLPDGSESVVSNESCINIPIKMPIFTNVTVDSTSTTKGVITVRWTTPIEMDTSACPLPYTYELFRNEGERNINTRTLISVTNDLFDTTFVDKNLNTLEKNYSYSLRFTCQNISLEQKIQDQASNVILSTSSGSEKINLSWTAEVPWNNRFQYHYIYREINNQFVLIDSVYVTTFVGEYTDEGRYNNIPLRDSTLYCYYVETIGSYGNPILISPFNNKSQIKCEMPVDSVGPCPPVLSIDSLDCEKLIKDPFSIISNKLFWQNQPYTAECDSDIVSYTIYYFQEKTENLNDFKKIGTSIDTFFVYENPLNLSGCYVLTASDQYGNEGEFSNIVCTDNCIYYELPNIFTPNGDGVNDFFVPRPTPRFVKSVDFVVYNRWGDKVKTISDDIYLNWDGKSNNGKLLPDGIYFYYADVEFFTLSEENRRKTIKGWVQILR
jgi:gliding motility-associated-like protein